MKAGRVAVLTLVAAIVAAGMVVPLAQWAFGALVAVPSIAALGDAGIETLFTLALFGILIGIALAALAIEGRRLAAGSAVLIGAGIGIGGMTLAVALGWLAGIAHIAGSDGAHGIALLLLGMLVVAFQSTAEEIYFRGWLQPALVRGWGPLAGIAVTALAFAGLHIAGGARGPVTLINLWLAGVLFGLIAYRTGGILAAATAHAGWNGAEGLIFGLDPNPGIGSFGAMIDLDLVGSPSWGGSAEGLNASIGVTIVLTALILPLIAWQGRPKAVAIS